MSPNEQVKFWLLVTVFIMPPTEQVVLQWLAVIVLAIEGGKFVWYLIRE